MRFWLSHRLPGGFRGGVLFGGSRRPRRLRPVRGRVRVRTRTRIVRPGPSVVVHMSAAEYAAHEEREREEAARGCALVAKAVGLLVAFGAVVAYWQVAVPLLAVAGTAVAVAAVRSRR